MRHKDETFVIDDNKLNYDQHFSELPFEQKVGFKNLLQKNKENMDMKEQNQTQPRH